jgi:putative hemolysin
LREPIVPGTRKRPLVAPTPSTRSAASVILKRAARGASGPPPGAGDARPRPPADTLALFPPPFSVLGSLAPGSSLLWWAVGVGALTLVLAAVEHGWTRLSRTRLADTAAGPESRTRLERMLAQGDRVEDALIVMRVGSQVTLVALLVALAFGMLAEGETPPSLTTAITTAGVVAFIWITLFCRVLPAEMSAHRLEGFVRTTMPVLVACSYVLGPPIDLCRQLARRMTGHTPEIDAELYQDEIRSQLEEGEREGHLGGEQADMIEAVLELRTTEVHHLMTPRTEIDVVDIDCTVEKARLLTQKSGRSRYPLVEGAVDKVVGILHVKDLLCKEGSEPLTALAREPWFVPESKYCTELLSEFRLKHQHLAVVLDEYGGTAGIITIEDVLEEIVGEIDDEFDEEEEVPELEILDPRNAVAQGAMHVDELNEKLSINLPENDDWSTLGGLIFHTLGRLPSEGEELRQGNVLLRIDLVIDRRIDRVAIKILEEAV